MLKILVGSQNIEKYLPNKRVIRYANKHFNEVKKPEWFRDELVKEIIDNSYIEKDFSVVNKNTHVGYSVDTIAGGSKSLILCYKCPDRIILVHMGDNCTDFLERIALQYEKEGKDLVIVTDYINKFKFNYIDKIHFINWDITVSSWKDICSKIRPLWYKMEDSFKEEE